jgi:hypothetical protein
VLGRDFVNPASFGAIQIHKRGIRMTGNEVAVEAVASEDEVTVEETAGDFRRVMAWVTDHACAEGREEEVMEALFAVIVNVGDHDGEDPDPR